jgi:hypothetical protein
MKMIIIYNRGVLFGMANGIKDTSPQALRYICIVTFGNAIGSFILPLYQKFEMRNTNK